MTASTDRLERIARAEVGYREGRSNGHWNNDQKFSDELPGFAWSDRQAWCATFVCWVFWKAGLYELLPSPSAGVDQLASGFKKSGRWSAYPAIGAVVCFGTPADLSHTGIVVAYDRNTITTIEGNTNANGSREGDGVYVKQHARRDSYVVGYGYPKFPEGIHSADPAWRHARPKPPPKVKRRGNVAAAERAIGRAIKANRKAPRVVHALEAARHALATIPGPR